MQGILLPALEILESVVQFAPGAEHDAAYLVRIADGVARRDRRAEGERDDDRPLDAELCDQLLQVAGLVDEREAVIGPAGLRMPTPVVGEAAMVGRKLCDLVLPVFQPMDFAVDEDEIGPAALHFIVEVATVGVDQGHAFSLYCDPA